jgi:hypothetical protein
MSGLQNLYISTELHHARQSIPIREDTQNERAPSVHTCETRNLYISTEPCRVRNALESCSIPQPNTLESCYDMQTKVDRVLFHEETCQTSVGKDTSNKQVPSMHASETRNLYISTEPCRARNALEPCSITQPTIRKVTHRTLINEDTRNERTVDVIVSEICESDDEEINTFAKTMDQRR